MFGTKTTKTISVYIGDIDDSWISPTHDIYKVKNILKQKCIKSRYLLINEVETIKERIVTQVNRQFSQPQG